MIVMAYFQPPYYSPMDRAYHEGDQESPKLEEPIFPISRLGTTVPESDPSGRTKNLIQGIQANIRHGAGTMQIVMSVPPESALGGRAKAYGEEVREAIREVAKANEILIGGFEMPTSSVTGMSGFDPQQMQFSDERRQLHMNEVKDVMKFAAETAGGGGVDMVSFEFPRPITGGEWKDADKFVKPGEQRIGWLVDKRTGRVQQFRKDEVQQLPVTNAEGEIDTYKKDIIDNTTGKILHKKGEIIMEKWPWEKFEEEAKKQGMKPEKLYVDKQLDSQKKTLMGLYSTYRLEAENHKRQAQKAEEEIKIVEGMKERIAPEKRREKLDELRDMRESHLRIWKERMNAAAGNLSQAEDLEERKNSFMAMDDFAKNRSITGYAELGINAMDTTKHNKYAKRDLYVGPEIGWPEHFGGHPDEFKDLILDSRKQMVRMLTDPRLTNSQGKYVDKSGDVVDKSQAAKNPYFRSNVDPATAKSYAKRHIKGMFDTSHMGMWLAHFKPNEGESEDSRLERFNKWYVEKVREIAKSGVVGGIQLVDSMSAAHGHLPPGQGIFPIKDAAKIFKDEGFQGYLVSEGHEEEKFNEGRIMTKTWELLGAKPGQSYFGGGGGGGQSWGQVANSYFGRTYSPLMMFGSYAPSNEFKLWSEIPLE
jgi:hypothetical protein